MAEPTEAARGSGAPATKQSGVQASAQAGAPAPPPGAEPSRPLRPEDSRPSLLTVLTLVGATAGWGAGATMSRLAVEEMGPLMVACVRFGLGALLLLAILIWRGQTRGLPSRKEWWPLVVLGVLGVTAFGALYTVGLQWTSATEGTLIQGLSPLLTMVGAAVLVGEPIRRGPLLGSVVAFGGLAVLLLGGAAGLGGGADRLLGNLVVIGACICWSGYNVAVRVLAARLNLAESSAYGLLVGTALLIPFALLEPVRVPIGSIGLTTWLAISYLAVVSTCLAYIWWNDGIRKIGAGRAAMFSFVGPVAAMLSAIPLLGEWPEPAQLVGGGLILAGLLVANRR